MDDTTSDSRREFEQLLTGYKTAILTTLGPDGHFHCRPMAMQEQWNGGQEIWFATSTETEKCTDIARHPHVALSFHSSERDAAYLSISGHAEIVRDRALIHRMWSPGWKAWFPEGPDQEDLALIRVTAEHAEWVRPEGGKVKVLYTMAKQALTGRRESPGEKRTTNLQ